MFVSTNYTCSRAWTGRPQSIWAHYCLLDWTLRGLPRELGPSQKLTAHQARPGFCQPAHHSPQGQVCLHSIRKHDLSPRKRGWVCLPKRCLPPLRQSHSLWGGPRHPPGPENHIKRKHIQSLPYECYDSLPLIMNMII